MLTYKTIKITMLKRKLVEIYNSKQREVMVGVNYQNIDFELQFL